MRATVTVLKTAKRHAAEQTSSRDDIGSIEEELRLVALAVAGLAHECCEDAERSDGLVNRIYQIIGRIRDVDAKLSPIDFDATKANIKMCRA